jgi:hypothetical protein
MQDDVRFGHANLRSKSWFAAHCAPTTANCNHTTALCSGGLREPLSQTPRAFGSGGKIAANLADCRAIAST